MPVFSIVTTLYQSESHLQKFYQRMRNAVLPLSEDYEIILVNDGATDGSLSEAVKIHHQDPRVQVIDLSRNFGHHRAMMTGLSYAKGAWVFLIDCDLEEDPDWIRTFHEKAVETGSDLIFGVQAHRKGGWFERFTGYCFYRLFNLLSDVKLHPSPTTARLMTSRFVASLLRHQERELFLAGLCAITGYRQEHITVLKQDKKETSYTLQRRLTLFVQAITAFSEKPLVYIFYLGLTIASVSAVGSGYLVYRRLVHKVTLLGWASLIVSVWFLSGLLALCMGVIGIYIARLYTEIKSRPYAIVREHYRSGLRPDDDR